MPAHIIRIRRYAVTIAAAWTILIATSIAWFYFLEHRNILVIAHAEATAALEKDLLYRRWGARHGGVYVPLTPETSSSSYLAHIPERDITTPSGKALTLINPAFMTRQVFESALKENKIVRGHLTSLRPIRPGNAPDPWEYKALVAFLNGPKEISELQEIDGRQYMRVMQPFVAGEECLKCHSGQGYRVGDILGGISASVPLASFSELSNSLMVGTSCAHGLIWLMGLGLIGVGSRKLTRSSASLYAKSVLLEEEVGERQVAQEALEEQASLLEEEIAQRQRTQERLLQRERFLQTIIDTEPECVKMMDKEGKLLMMNRAGLAMIEADSFDTVEGSKVSCIVAAAHRCSFEQLNADIFEGNAGVLQFEAIGLKGKPVWLESHAVPFRNESGEIIAALSITKDISERKRHEEELLYLANYDVLTGLPNRHLLNDRINQAIIAGNRDRCFMAVMLMDLDNFKIVNDSLGHNVGDLLLKAVADRIKTVEGSAGTIARLGGDEFAVMPGQAATYQDAAELAGRILALFSTPFSLEGREIFISVSIGIAVYPQDGDSVDTLLKHADSAMYHAKLAGKNNFQFFTRQINERILERMTMETRLRRALEQDEFHLYYQPVMQLSSGRTFGVETLLRWFPGGEEAVAPEKFIPLLEDTGLIIPVGEWVLDNACRQLRAWQVAGHELRLSVNISARQFHTADIVNRLTSIVESSGCFPAQICLELTESVIMENIDENIHKLLLLKNAGFSLAIDDFGIGFSSLNYLKQLPISELKIDKTFIDGIPSDTNDIAIVKTITTMAAFLQLRVVAEGVETEEQLRFLSEIACDFVQGYYFSKPLPPGKLFC